MTLTTQDAVKLPAGDDGAMRDRRSRRLEDVSTRLSLFLGTVDDLTHRLRQVNDDVFGTEPEEVTGTEAAEPPVNGIYNDLDMRLRYLDNGLSRLTRAVDRLTENL